MLGGLATRLSRPVHVIHNDQKLFTFTPDGWEEEKNRDKCSAIVYNVWGEHAFFYRPEKAQRAARMNVRPVREVPTRCLAVRGDDMPDRVPFEEQLPFYINRSNTTTILDMAARSTWRPACTQPTR